jgi:hypothetical protein
MASATTEPGFEPIKIALGLLTSVTEERRHAFDHTILRCLAHNGMQWQRNDLPRNAFGDAQIPSTTVLE